MVTSYLKDQSLGEKANKPISQNVKLFLDVLSESCQIIFIVRIYYVGHDITHSAESLTKILTSCHSNPPTLFSIFPFPKPFSCSAPTLWLSLFPVFSSYPSSPLPPFPVTFFSLPVPLPLPFSFTFPPRFHPRTPPPPLLLSLYLNCKWQQC